MERMVRERGGLKFHLLDDGDGGMDTAKLNVDELDVDGNVQVCGVTTQALVAGSHMCTRDLTQKLSIELCWTLFKQLLAHVNAAIKQRR